MILQKSFFKQICSSRNISYGCWQLRYIFFWILWRIESKKKGLFKIEIFCSNVQVFTVTCNVSLLNKSINFFKKKKNVLTDFKLLNYGVCKCSFVAFFGFLDWIDLRPIRWAVHEEIFAFKKKYEAYDYYYYYQ